MQKRILPLLLTPLLALFSTHAMALTCGDDSAQNSVESNNYIFQILDYIDTPSKGIQKETRTTTTTNIQENVNIPVSTAKQSLEYDKSGLITKSDYDLYSSQNDKLYSERLIKTDTGWENIVEDFEDQKSSVIKFTTDEQGRIIESQQAKKAADFVFIETDTYLYTPNNCIMTKTGKWQLKEVDLNGNFTGVNESGSSQYTFQYKDNRLAKVAYDFSNDMKSENTFLYQYDINNRLVSVQSIYASGSESTPYTTQFLTFDEKGEWLSASKERKTKRIVIERAVNYY